jgi:hypothetical protein
MPEGVSTVGLCLLGYVALSTYAKGGGSAISIEASAARKAANAVIDSVERSQALFGEKAAAISKLRALAIECGQENWDAHGAAMIDPTAIFNAEAVVRALPIGVPLPEFAPEPDGSVSLDWIQSRTRQFSLSVGRNQRLAYAWLDGTDSGHAVATFDGSTIPPLIIDGISAIAKNGHASIGTF